MRALRKSQVTFEITCEPEHIPYEGNCSAIDETTDRETEDWIARQLESGNEWAWCCVKVVARWKSFEGVDYLGGCSYLSEANFIECNDYFSSMKDEALADLNRTIAALRADLCPKGCDHGNA
jgi:hypothetical protein